MVAVNKMQIYTIKVYITLEYFPQTSFHLSLNKSVCNIKQDLLLSLGVRLYCNKHFKAFCYPNFYFLATLNIKKLKFKISSNVDFYPLIMMSIK